MDVRVRRREQLLLDAYLTHNRDARHPIVVLDEATIITNAAAARLLGGLDQAMLWEHASRALGHAADVPPSLALDGVQVAVECHPVTAGDEAVGAVLILKPEPNRERARLGRALAGQCLADLPGLVGRSPRWQALCRAVAAAGDGSVLVVGEPGTGRLAVARSMLAPRSDTEPIRVLDAAEAAAFGAIRWLREVEREDRQGETLVLRHLDLLDIELARATRTTLDRREGDRRVLATSTVGIFAAGAGNPLLESFSTEIAVPPLRERLADLPALLVTMTKRAVGDGPPVRWMPDAVQALSRLDWPGNLTSLDALVRRLVSRCRVGYIGAADLPADLVARASRRRLAGLEQAEARTIMHALHDAGGNKHQAASSLGIARSTLYRKVRALGLDLSTAAF